MTDTFQHIIEAFKRQEFHQAELLCWSALKTNPKSKKHCKWLGLSLLQQKKYEGGLRYLLECLPEMDGDFDVINNIAFSYRHLEDYQNSLKFLDRADKIDNNSYAAKYNRAHVHLRLSNYNDAASLCEQCYKLIQKNIDDKAKNSSELDQLYFDIMLAQNNSEYVILKLKEKLKHSFDARFFYNLINTKNSEVSSDLIAQAQDFAMNKENFFLHRSFAFFGLGRIYEKEKNYEEAFKNYHTGNELKAEKIRFKPFAKQEKIKKIFHYFNEELYKKVVAESDKEYLNRGSKCIFIVGNPRSGTSLVESILGSADEICSAGELNKFLNLYTNIDNDFSSENIKNIGLEYLKILNGFDQENKHKFVIDKMPENINSVGLIRLCLPAAKIICLDRAILDNAWSIYTQIYLANIPYSSSLFNLGIHMANTDALKKFWLSQKFNNNNYMVINYEELVSDPDRNSKKLFNFIGVDSKYDEEKRQKFFSRTASKAQVQKKIYSSSVSRSEKYGPLMTKFEESYDNQKKYWDFYFQDKN